MNTRIVDKGWDAYKRRMDELAKRELAVGILSDAGSHDNGMSVAEAAAVNEFGSEDGRIPERPAWRETFEDNKPRLKKVMAKTVNNIAEGADMERELERAGQWYAGQQKKAIRDFDDPANAPSTIEKKGADNPLVDTGRTINSIQPVVRKRG